MKFKQISHNLYNGKRQKVTTLKQYCRKTWKGAEYEGFETEYVIIHHQDNNTEQSLKNTNTNSTAEHIKAFIPAHSPEGGIC